MYLHLGLFEMLTCPSHTLLKPSDYTAIVCLLMVNYKFGLLNGCSFIISKALLLTSNRRLNWIGVISWQHTGQCYGMKKIAAFGCQPSLLLSSWRLAVCLHQFQHNVWTTWHAPESLECVHSVNCSRQQVLVWGIVAVILEVPIVLIQSSFCSEPINKAIAVSNIIQCYQSNNTNLPKGKDAWKSSIKVISVTIHLH